MKNNFFEMSAVAREIKKDSLVRAVNLILTLDEWADVCETAIALVLRRTKSGWPIWRALSDRSFSRMQRIEIIDLLDVENFIAQNPKGASAEVIAEYLECSHEHVRKILESGFEKIKETRKIGFFEDMPQEAHKCHF